MKKCSYSLDKKLCGSADDILLAEDEKGRRPGAVRVPGPAPGSPAPHLVPLPHDSRPEPGEAADERGATRAAQPVVRAGLLLAGAARLLGGGQPEKGREGGYIHAQPAVRVVYTSVLGGRRSSTLDSTIKEKVRGLIFLLYTSIRVNRVI